MSALDKVSRDSDFAIALQDPSVAFILEDPKLEPMAPQIGDCVLEFMTALTEFLSCSIRFLARNYLVNTVVTAGGFDGVTNAIDSLNEWRTILDREVGRAAQLEILSHRRDVLRSKTMEALSTLTYNNMHDVVRSRRIERSGLWFVEHEHFKAWLKHGRATLWCSGFGMFYAEWSLSQRLMFE